MERIRIATRKSPLAVIQAEIVAERLRGLHEGCRIELVRLTTRGDRLLDAPLAKVGGKGLFVKELERALLEGAADIAVHSVKDVTVEIPKGLSLPVILSREDPTDAFVSNRFRNLEGLTRGASVGTSSLRRRVQLLALRPDLEVHNLRGGVLTRLEKLDAGGFDAIILASAGLRRLGLEGRIAERLDPARFIPAVGQGALGIECRAEDTGILEAIAALHDEDTASCVLAERAMNRALGGGCQLPIAGFADLDGAGLHLRGLVGSPDSRRIVRAQASDEPANALTLGQSVARQLLERGAQEILEEVYAASAK